MPRIEKRWRLPQGVRDHGIERMRDRKISLDDLNQLRLWLETRPEVPEGPWYKDFGSCKLCGDGSLPQDVSTCGPGCKRTEGLDCGTLPTRRTPRCVGHRQRPREKFGECQPPRTPLIRKKRE